MFWRLFGTYGVVFVASISLLGLVVARRVERRELLQIEDNLKFRAQMVTEAIRGSAPAGLSERVNTLVEDYGPGLRITLIDRAGAVLADSARDPETMDSHLERPEIVAARQSATGTDVRVSRTVGEELVYLAIRHDQPGSPVAFVRVALPAGQINEQLGELRTLIITTAAGAALLALVLAAYLARIIARPIQEVTRAAEEIAAGKYGQTVYAAGRDEVARLARTFNHMSAALAAHIARLGEEQQQFRAILGGMVEGVVALDAQQRVLFANDRAAQLLDFAIGGRTPAEAVGHKLWDVARQRPLLDLVKRALARPEPQKVEINWTGPVSRNVTVHAVRLPGDSPRGAVLVVHDTTELRRLERMRQDFVANVSHELKTPLACIMASVETLLDGGALDDPGASRSFLGQIADQSERLHRLILDLLSLARIESGAELFSFKEVEVGEAVQACVERHRARAEAKGQSLEADALPNPVPAWVDEEALSEILDNLVDNAVKYTPEGGRIRVRWWEEAEAVCLEVADTGIGIPPQDLPRIFERFYRVDKARSREMGGTGLGLSIVKHLVQSLHGSISCTSQVGAGTTFTVRLPRPGGPANGATGATTAAAGG